MGTFLSGTLGAVHKGRPQRGGRGFVKSGRGEGGGGGLGTCGRLRTRGSLKI